ncbi:MAG: TPM domain-containing protein [Victivallaceae bacterium]|nr:TPM domain-containing protein [Victivallaceae bacterium]
MYKLLLAIPLLAVSCIIGAATVPLLTGRVVDNADVFSDCDRVKIDKMIRDFERASGGQMAVLTIKTLNGEPIEDFSIRVAEKWKIGKKGQDNGAILVIAVDDHQMRLEVGYGWEGVINDARAGDVIREMVPFFRKEQYGNGVTTAVARVQAFVTGNEPADMPLPEESERSNSEIIIMIVFFSLFIFMGLFFRNGRGGRGGFFHGGGSGGSGGFGGGGFHGGGGSFGGGGASGRW